MANLWHSLVANSPARKFALLVLVSVLVGNFLCDMGTMSALWLGIEPTHFLNKWFLLTGVLGICGFGFALFCRRNLDNHPTVGEVK